MKTVVIQAFAHNAEPEWVKDCRKTVKAWALKNEYEYVFYGDEFLDYCPEWARNRLHFTIRKHNILPVCDLARLYAMRYANLAGKRAIWVDADVVVLDPDNFKLPDKAFITVDAVLHQESDGSCKYREGLTNAILGFYPSDDFLLKYIGAAEAEVLKVTNPLTIDPMMLGPVMLARLIWSLTGVGYEIPRLLTGVGCFDATYIKHFHTLVRHSNHHDDPVDGECSFDDDVKAAKSYMAAYRRCIGAPIVAANVCHSVNLNIKDADELQMRNSAMWALVWNFTKEAWVKTINSEE